MQPTVSLLFCPTIKRPIHGFALGPLVFKLIMHSLFFNNRHDLKLLQPSKSAQKPNYVLGWQVTHTPVSITEDETIANQDIGSYTVLTPATIQRGSDITGTGCEGRQKGNNVKRAIENRRGILWPERSGATLDDDAVCVLSKHHGETCLCVQAEGKGSALT